MNNKCSVTELPIVSTSGFSYKIKVNDEILQIEIGRTFESFSKTELYLKNKHIIAGAIINKQLSSNDEFYSFALTESDLTKNIPQIIYPKTPKDKMENLLKSLHDLQSYEGERVAISDKIKKPEFYYKHFFRSMKECSYYMESLHYQGFIELVFDNIGVPFEYRLTYKGLDYYFALTEFGSTSNKCFVAMSFDPKMKKIRAIIKTVLELNEFEPLLIDEQLIDSSQTINDAIISAIKSCKFCIADFTEQKDGVYFESGFAVGLGKPVIYTCRKDWFDKSHFDTNHFPHLIYESEEDLLDQLDKKIKARIK
jgi:hypothetical protein